MRKGCPHTSAYASIDIFNRTHLHIHRPPSTLYILRMPQYFPFESYRFHANPHMLIPSCMCSSSSLAIFGEKRRPQAPNHMLATFPKKASNPHGCLCTHVQFEHTSVLAWILVLSMEWSLCRFQDTDLKNMFTTGHTGSARSFTGQQVCTPTQVCPQTEVCAYTSHLPTSSCPKVAPPRIETAWLLQYSLNMLYSHPHDK